MTKFLRLTTTVVAHILIVALCIIAVMMLFGRLVTTEYTIDGVDIVKLGLSTPEQKCIGRPE